MYNHSSYHKSGGVSLFGGLNYGFLLIYLALVVIGMVAVTSATWRGDEGDIFSLSNEYMKHLVYIGLSLVIGFVILLFDSSIWHKYAYLFYIASILMALSTLLPGIGLERNGARAWIGVGGFTLQPIEFAMVGLALAIARLMSAYSFAINHIRSLLQVGLMIVPIFVVVWLQNDFGTGLIACSLLLMLFREGLNIWLCVLITCVVVLFLLSMVMEITPLLVALIVLFSIITALLTRRFTKQIILYASAVFLISILLYYAVKMLVGSQEGEVQYHWFLLGTTLASLPMVIWFAFRSNVREFFLMITLFVVSISVMMTSSKLYEGLHGYQKARIDTFLGLSHDRNATYNVDQSKIAIGSGGIWGKGYLEGTQIRYKMVPERHTDFIFCTICEERGIVGAGVVFVLYALFILLLMRMGDNQRESFGRVYCYSAASMLLYHIVVNIGFTIGFMPVMGITLPLISYGGSSLLATSIMVFIAMALDASTRRALPVYRKW